MVNAAKQARQTFRYFWRELCWERRRIIPGLDFAAIKVAFSDPQTPGTTPTDQPAVEQMWVNEIDFDGKAVTGTLLNQPNWLKSVSAGDQVKVPPSRVNDWMYAVMGEVFGGYTVNAMRSKMSKAERKGHDEAWGMDFGNPDVIRVVPDSYLGRNIGFFSRLFGGKPKPQSLEELAAHEHPMALNMGESLNEMLQKDPSAVHETDDKGATFLHQMASAGTPSGVQIVLNHGGDKNAVTTNGLTASQLAKSLGWKQVMAVLAR